MQSCLPQNTAARRVNTEGINCIMRDGGFFTEINFEKWRKYGIIGVMKNNGITEYFEEVEITKEYDGYYYSI